MYTNDWCSFGVDPDKIASAEHGRPDLFEHFRKENHVFTWRLYHHGKEPAPYHDHGRTYKLRYEGRQRQIHVFHEYVGHKRERWDDICQKTKEWAARNNKVAEIYDGSHSWYYFDENGLGTALIIIRPPDVEVTVL